MIKIVIVDDSQTARLALRRALESDPQILVVAEAQSGSEALRAVERFSPDLITMDVYLEEENGLDVTLSIMSRFPRPIVVVTGMNPTDPALVYKAMDRGALDVFPKLPASTDPAYDERRKALLRVVKNLSKVPVLTRRSPTKSKPPLEPPAQDRRPAHPEGRSPMPDTPTPEVVLIGASTGGPPVLSRLLASLPKPFPIPVVIVQHISSGFDAGFAHWIQQTSGFQTVLVQRQTRVAPNTVLVAPDSQNLHFVTSSTLAPTPTSETDLICPSINVLFKSGARHIGPRATGVLLTGMGRDGAEGLKALRDAGASTIAQAPETCAVDSMPQSAVNIGAVMRVMPPEQIAYAISSLAARPKGPSRLSKG